MICPETGTRCESTGCTVYTDGRCGKQTRSLSAAEAGAMPEDKRLHSAIMDACDPECQGRCQWCPATVIRDHIDALLARVGELEAHFRQAEESRQTNARLLDDALERLRAARSAERDAVEWAAAPSEKLLLLGVHHFRDADLRNISPNDGFACHVEQLRCAVKAMHAYQMKSSPQPAVDATFTREVCEALFGNCLVDTGDHGTGYECGACGEQIYAGQWTTATHKPDCVINRVRDFLWSAVPESERKNVLGNYVPSTAKGDGRE